MYRDCYTQVSAGLFNVLLLSRPPSTKLLRQALAAATR
jgi:hypothetical protein